MIIWNKVAQGARTSATFRHQQGMLQIHLSGTLGGAVVKMFAMNPEIKLDESDDAHWVDLGAEGSILSAPGINRMPLLDGSRYYFSMSGGDATTEVTLAVDWQEQGA